MAKRRRAVKRKLATASDLLNQMAVSVNPWEFPVQAPRGYTGDGEKKGPVLVVRFKDGSLQQFPQECNYHFRRVNSVRMAIVKDGDKVVAHIAHEEIRSITCPEYLIRDGDAR